MQATSPYPATRPERDRWILDRRTARRPVDPFRPHGYLIERERTESGIAEDVATIFLTNRECPWRCLMCDLWKTTLTEPVPVGAIPRQIDYAFEQLGLETSSARCTEAGALRNEIRFSGEAKPAPRQVKLYNGGSFFDSRAIPPADYGAIAERVGRFDRVVVECHPALVRQSCVRFRDLLAAQNGGGRAAVPPGARLEVAMGLETVEPGVLDRLNKQMSLEEFARAAAFLHRHDIALRVFVLVKPPFMHEPEALDWAKRSIDFAFNSKASVVSLIPTRAGNGALEALEQMGQFAPPRLGTLEASHDYGVGLHQGRVFADLWDLERFSECGHCFPARRARLERMNLDQTVEAPVSCADCCTVLADQDNPCS
jgi:radical SAM enzyme (TIGR01210 family)